MAKGQGSRVGLEGRREGSGEVLKQLKDYRRIVQTIRRRVRPNHLPDRVEVFEEVVLIPNLSQGVAQHAQRDIPVRNRPRSPQKSLDEPWQQMYILFVFQDCWQSIGAENEDVGRGEGPVDVRGWRGQPSVDYFRFTGDVRWGDVSMEECVPNAGILASVLQVVQHLPGKESGLLERMVAYACCSNRSTI